MSIDIQQYKVTREPFYQPQGNEVALDEATYRRRLPVVVEGPTGVTGNSAASFWAPGVVEQNGVLGSTVSATG